MARVKIGPGAPDRKTLDVELARLLELDVGALRARWQMAFRRKPAPQLPRHLQVHVLAYRLQADRLGDLDVESKRLLDRAGSPEQAGQRAVDQSRRVAEIRLGTVLGREENERATAGLDSIKTASRCSLMLLMLPRTSGRAVAIFVRSTIEESCCPTALSSLKWPAPGSEDTRLSESSLLFELHRA
jgi:hypothetical protein